MPDFEVADGRRASVDGRIYEQGQTVTVDDADTVKGLVNRGILVKPGRSGGEQESSHSRADEGVADPEQSRRRERTQRG